MKIWPDVQQGTEEWLRLRMGRPTASNFDKIVSPVKCQLSATSKHYALKLVAERLLRVPSELFNESYPWMERGKQLEPRAVKQYEFANEVETVAVGMIAVDESSWSPACSPDRLVVPKDKERIAVEVKCPSPHVHLGYLLNGVAADYRPQVQGQILIAELDRADLYSYHPRMPPQTIQTYRDDEYIAKLDAALRAFAELVAKLTERAAALGVYQAFEASAEARELEGALQAEAGPMFPYDTGQA